MTQMLAMTSRDRRLKVLARFAAFCMTRMRLIVGLAKIDPARDTVDGAAPYLALAAVKLGEMAATMMAYVTAPAPRENAQRAPKTASPAVLALLPKRSPSVRGIVPHRLRDHPCGRMALKICAKGDQMLQRDRLYRFGLPFDQAERGITAIAPKAASDADENDNDNAGSFVLSETSPLPDVAEPSATMAFADLYDYIIRLSVKRSPP